MYETKILRNRYMFTDEYRVKNSNTKNLLAASTAVTGCGWPGPSARTGPKNRGKA